MTTMIDIEDLAGLNAASPRPPHDREAQEAVLSACLVDPDAMTLVAPLLTLDSFYGEAHRRIFEAALALWQLGQPVDVVQVGTWLKDHGRLSQVGGMAYLTEVLNSAPAVAHIEAYAATVAKKARIRSLQLTCRRLLAEIDEPIADEDEFLDRAERLVHEVGAARASLLKTDTMRAVLERVWVGMQSSAERGERDRIANTTGLDALDCATGGLFDGESTIVAARPAMGKTSLVMSIATHVAHRGAGVIVFSLEMPNVQIVTRALCARAGVDGRRARTNTFDPHDWQLLAGAVQQAMAPEHFYLIDQPCGLLEMRSEVRRRQADMERAGVRLGLIVIDYVQLMTTPRNARSREEGVAENARGLKLLAKEMHAPVFALSQLNREVEKRTDKRPMLSDMRESGALEEAADTVISMYRDDYYDDQSKTPGVVELALLKQRHGPTGVVHVGFRASSTSFHNLAGSESQPAASEKFWPPMPETWQDRYLP